MDSATRGADSRALGGSTSPRTCDATDSPSTLETAANALDEVPITDVSCQRCRKRRVKCNRTFPRCSNCTNREETCDLKDWTPLPAGETRPRGRQPKKSKTQQSATKGKEAFFAPPGTVVAAAMTREAVDDEASPSAEEDSIAFKTPTGTSKHAAALDGFGSSLQGSSSSSAPSSLAPRPASKSPSEFASTHSSSAALQSLPAILRRRQPRLALCRALTQGESSLVGLAFPSLDLHSLSTQLASNCPLSPESSSMFPPSGVSNLATSTSFPSPDEASRALSTYFAQIEPSLRLFPTNASRQYLYEGSKHLWDMGVVSGGQEWQALYLATVGASAVVSTDEQYIASARDWMQQASQLVFHDLRFAANPTLVSLRTFLVILHTHLLGGFSTFHLPETLSYLPILISAAYKLELNFDWTDLNRAASLDMAEEKRGLWYEISKLEVIWSTLSHASNPSIDFSNASARPPFYLSSAAPPGTVAPIETLSRSSPDAVLRVVSRLGRLVNSNSPLAARDLQAFSDELLACERDLVAREESGMYRSILHYALLRLQAFAEETSGVGPLGEAEWSRILADLLELIDKVSGCDMVDRLPMLLFILQGAIMAGLKLVSLSLSQQPLRLSLHSRLQALTTSLRTTPWPAYLHQFVKRGVITVEHLLAKSVSNATVAPSLTQSSPGSSQRTNAS
ncbi:hypothetical protein JCM11491_005586 [Sporobolomyces phaffii]